jgi:hypothetical protein
MKLLGVHDKADLKRAADLLLKHTTDSSCMVKASDIEPVFVLRAKDPCAAVGVAAWINEAKKRGMHRDKLVDAQEALKEFLEYKPS